MTIDKTPESRDKTIGNPIRTAREYGTGNPTFRYNPKTHIGRLSVEAWREIGQPEEIGLYHEHEQNRVYFYADETDPHNIRKLSPKRTITVRYLRSILPDTPSSYPFHIHKSGRYGWIQIEEAVTE